MLLIKNVAKFKFQQREMGILHHPLKNPKQKWLLRKLPNLKRKRKHQPKKKLDHGCQHY